MIRQPPRSPLFPSAPLFRSDPGRLGRGRRRLLCRRGAHRLDPRGARLRAPGGRHRSGRHVRASDRRRDRPARAPARPGGAGARAPSRDREPDVGPGDGARRLQARGRALLAPRQARRDRGALSPPRRDEVGVSIRADLYRRLLGYLRPHVPALVIGTVLAIVVAATEGTIAWLVKPAMDDVFIRRDARMLKLIPLLFLAAYIA